MLYLKRFELWLHFNWDIMRSGKHILHVTLTLQIDSKVKFVGQTYDLDVGIDLHRVKMKHHHKYRGQRSFRFVRTHRHTNRIWCSTWTSKLVGNNSSEH